MTARACWRSSSARALRLAMPLHARRDRRAGQRARRRAEHEPRRHDADGAFVRRDGLAGRPASPLIGLALRRCWPRCRSALLQAWLSVTLRANQIVSGIGINILALGATTLAYREIFGSRSRVEIPGLRKLESAAARRPAGARARDLPAGLARVRGLRADRAGRACAAPHLARARRCAAAGAEPRSADKSGGLGAARALRRGAVRRLHVGARRRLHLARRHPHLHRRHDQRRRLSRACRA